MAQTVLSPRSWETNKAPGYISWLNALLNQRGLVVNDLSRDLRDGVILLNLIEIITGRNVDSLGLKFKKSPVRYGDQPFPKSRDEQLENVRSAFKCLEHFNIKTAGCEPEDIVDGNAQLMTALIFSFKKYAKDHSVNIIAGPTNSSDTSMSTSVTDTTTKLSKSGVTTLNNSTVIAIKNNDKELERSYRGGSGSAQNSLANLPNTTRSRSGNKKSPKDKDKDHGVKDKEKDKHKDLDDLSKLSPEEKAKKTNPIRIDQIHRANNKMPTPNLDLIGEIRDQLDETQRDLEFTESPSKHIWELNKLIHKAKEMEKELLQGERKRIQLTPVQSHGANPSSPRLLESPTSLRPIVDATGFDAVHEKVALQLNEATINNLMAKMKQQKTTRNSNKNANLEENMKKFRSNSIIQQKYNFARKKQLKFQRRSRTEYPLKEGRDDDNNRSTLFKVKVSQPGKSSKDNDTKTETTKIEVPTNTNTTTTKPVETATQKVSAATAENRQKVIEKLRRKSRAGLKKSKTTTEDKPAARVLRKSSSMKVIKPTVIMPLTDDVLEVSETAASKEEGDLRNRASDHNSDAGSDAEGSDSSSSESEVSRLEFGDRHIRRTGSLGSTTSTGSAIKPASHNNGSVTHSPVVSRAASSPQGLLVANAKGILNAAAPPLPIPAPKKSRPRSGAMVPVIPEKEETQPEPAQLSPTSPTPITTSPVLTTPTPEPANQEPIKAIIPPPGTTKVVAPVAKNPGGVKIGSAKGQPPKAGFKPGTAPSKTGVKQGPPPKAGTKQAPVGPKKVVEEHQPVPNNDLTSTTTMPSAFQRVIAATSPKRQTTSGETSSPVLSRVASFNAAANQSAVTKPRPESPVRRIETEVSVASLVDSFTSNSSKNSSPEPTRQKSSRDMLSPMRLSVRTGELDRVVSRTNSFNEISESQSLESSVSFAKDEHEAPQRSNSNNSTNPSSGNTTPHKDEQAVQSTAAPTAVNQPETKTNVVVEPKQEDKSVETVTVDKVTRPEDHIAKEEQVLESPKSEEKKELALTRLEDHIVRDEHLLKNVNNTEKTNQTDEPKKISLSIKSVSPTDQANDKSPGRTQYSKSVSVAKIGKASVNSNNGEKPQLQRKKSKTTDDIVANRPTVEEIEEANHLATSGENGTDSENSPSTPRRKRSFSDMSNIVVSNTKQKELEETNEEHAKKAQIQRQQSKNFLKSFYKSLKHSFSSTSKRNLVANPAKEGSNTNNEETKEPKKSDEHDHDDKAHKKDKKETKKMNKQASLGNVKDKDKIKSSKPNKSATSPNIQSNNNTNKK